MRLNRISKDLILKENTIAKSALDLDGVLEKNSKVRLDGFFGVTNAFYVRTLHDPVDIVGEFHLKFVHNARVFNAHNRRVRGDQGDFVD